MKDASVFRGTVVKGFVIRTAVAKSKAEFITAMGDVDVKSLTEVEFTKQYVPCSENPAHVAKVWLSGTKKIRDRARAMLETISKTEYPMNQTAPATPAAKTSAPAPAGKVATGEPKAPKAAKVPKAPKLDADGKPIPPKERKKLEWVRPKFANTAKFSHVATPNPRKAGTKSADWFTKYKVGGTVDEAIKAGAPRADIGWCIHLGFLKVDG